MSAFEGTTLCILAGLLWSVVGWAYRRAARNGDHPAGIIFALALCAVALVVPIAFATGDHPVRSVSQASRAYWWMVASGAANVAGGMCMQVAMARGQAGAAWAIIQSASLVSLLLSVAIHGERPSAMSWVGVAVMAASVALMARCQFRRERGVATGRGHSLRWDGTRWALIAMGLVGLQQTAMAQPSHLGFAEPASLRLSVFFAAMVCCAGSICAIARVRIDRGTWVAAGVAALAGLSGQYLVVRALDVLAAVGRAGLAYPCAVGSTIVTFAVWRRWRGDRLPWPAWLAMVLIVIGLLAIGLGDRIPVDVSIPAHGQH